MLAKFSINYIDIILLVVWIIAIAEGLVKGLVKQVFGILALILACYCSFRFTGFAAQRIVEWFGWNGDCLLYTSDAADDLLCVDLGGRRSLKKKKKTNQSYNIH